MVNQQINKIKKYLSFHPNISPQKIALFASVPILMLIVGITILQVQRRQDQQTGASVGIAALTNCEVSSSDLVLSSTEQAMISQINQYRQQNGIAVLKQDAILNRATAWMTRDMATNGYNAHTDSLGRNPNERANDCGFSGYAGENVGSSPSQAQMLSWWKGSDGHNKALLNSEYKVFGVSNTNWMWSVKFSTSDGTAPTATKTPIKTPTKPPTPSTSNQPTATRTPSPTRPPGGSISPTPPRVSMTPGGPRPTNIPTGNTTVLNVSVKIPQIAPQAVFPATVTVFDDQNRSVVSQVVQFWTSGNQHGGQMNIGASFTTGYYTVKIKGHNTLQKNVEPFIQYIENKKTTTIPTVILVIGDFNNDNILSIADLNILFACMRNTSCAQKAQADVNLDGAVNIQDYSIVRASFGTLRGN